MRSHVLQALRRCHPSRPGHLAQVEFEYERGGTLAYMGAYDVHRAHLIGAVADKTGIVPFMTLVEKVMTQEPYASATRVYWIVDNGSSHNGQRSDRPDEGGIPEGPPCAPAGARLLAEPDRDRLFDHLRKVVKPADFADLAALGDRLLRFENRYNETARPFDWRFTRDDLAEMLQRLEAHRPEHEAALKA